MEIAGFSRPAVPGEWSVNSINNQNINANFTTSSVTPSDYLARKLFYVESPYEQINFVFSGTFLTTNNGNTPPFQLIVDGISVAATRKTTDLVSGECTDGLFYSRSGFSSGWHTAGITWCSTGAGNGLRFQNNTIASLLLNHSNIIVRRSQTWNDKEMGGFSGLSWTGAYTASVTYSQLVNTSTTNTGTTLTFLGSVTHRTYLPNSSILVKFEACGTNAGAATVANSAKFSIRVNGVHQIGFGSQGHGSGFRFNANGLVVTAVQMGIQLIEVYWYGGTAGSTINPALVWAPAGAVTCSPTDHARIQVEEVLCPDVGNPYITDMGGYAVPGYNPMNVPQVRYFQLTNDVSQGGGPTAVLLGGPIIIWVNNGENSQFTIESTVSGERGFKTQIQINRNAVAGSYSAPDGGTNCLDSYPVTWVTTLPYGANEIRTTFFDDGASGGSVWPATHPDYAHHSLLVREYSAAQN